MIKGFAYDWVERFYEWLTFVEYDKMDDCMEWIGEKAIIYDIQKILIANY